jgi:hypothetical protein
VGEVERPRFWYVSPRYQPSVERPAPLRFMLVSSLWTPEGEHKVERPGSTPGGGSAPASDGPGRPSRDGPGGPGRGEDPIDEEEALREAELDEVRRQLLEAPVEVVIANHAYGLFELAALHLSAVPPDLDQARLAVDALGALIGGLEGRLGQVEPALMDALAQIRLAYVQISGAVGTEPESS